MCLKGVEYYNWCLWNAYPNPPVVSPCFWGSGIECTYFPHLPDPGLISSLADPVMMTGESCQESKLSLCYFRKVWKMLTSLLRIIKSCIGGGFKVCSQSELLCNILLVLRILVCLTFGSRHRGLVPKYSFNPSFIHSFIYSSIHFNPSFPPTFKFGFPECPACLWVYEAL